MPEDFNKLMNLSINIDKRLYARRADKRNVTQSGSGSVISKQISRKFEQMELDSIKKEMFNTNSNSKMVFGVDEQKLSKKCFKCGGGKSFV
jgi:hypothetical protein